MLHEKELELARLKEQIEKEKITLLVLQTKAEDEISKAQKLILEKDAELQAAEQSLSGLIEVTNDLANIVRRRSYKLIRELLANSLETSFDGHEDKSLVTEPDDNGRDEKDDKLNGEISLSSAVLQRRLVQITPLSTQMAFPMTIIAWIWNLQGGCSWRMIQLITWALSFKIFPRWRIFQ